MALTLLETGGRAWEDAQAQLKAAMSGPLSPRMRDLAESELVVGIAAMAGVGMTRFDSCGNTFAPLPGVGCDAFMDDSDATVVFVLPKVSAEGDEEVGAASPDEDGEDESLEVPTESKRVEDPVGQASKVFLREQPFMRALPQESMPAAEYQRLLRKGLEKVVVKAAGMRIESFQSIDADMVFWKITASEARLQEIAETCNYVMPYSAEAYDAVSMEAPRVNGIAVNAYGRYDAASAEDFQEFGSMDAIRLVTAELLRHVNLNELQSQRVIAQWFPSAKYAEMTLLTDEVIGWPLTSKKLCLPQDRDADYIRSYFGEEIAVFFSFYSTLVNSMRWPAALAVVVLLVKWCRPWNMSLTMAGTVQAIFGCMVIIWGIWFVSYAEHSVEMDQARWGADGHPKAEVQISYYEPKSRGHWKQGIFIALGKAITALFLGIVIFTCTTLALRVQHRLLSTVLQTATTFAFSFIWGKIAKQIVKLENPRTQARFNRSLTLRLTFVKLFIFFVPLIRLAFLAPVSGRVCAPNAANVSVATRDVAERYYSAPDFANNLQELGVAKDDQLFTNWIQTQRIDPSKNPIANFLLMLSTLDMDVANDLQKATGFAAGAADEEHVCFRGCFPKTCELDVEGSHPRLQCLTSCSFMLERSLNMLYFMHTVCTLAFIIVPMLQVRWAARREIEIGGANGKAYTLLQYQEKCCVLASYEYESWGGSYVEDFLEVVLGFAVLVCFSIVSPPMAIIGFVAQTFEYRLLAYRMSWVTCRPFPSCTEGLAEWLNILDVILYLAICMNSLLLICVLRTDLDRHGSMEKLIVIVLITLGLIAVKVVLRITLHEQPRDLVEANDHNHDFMQALWMLRNKGHPDRRESYLARAQIGVDAE